MVVLHGTNLFRSLSMKLIDFSKRFGQKILFDHLSFTFDQNKIYYLYGDNGIGKTTLFRCIVGIDSYSGTIEKTGSCFCVFDSTPFYLNLTGLDNLILLTKNRQIKELISKQKIDFLPLSFLSYVKVKNYSLGKKRYFRCYCYCCLRPELFY